MEFIDEQLYCSFCGKSEDEVDLLYAGQDGAMICRECAEKLTELFKLEDEKIFKKCCLS